MSNVAVVRLESLCPFPAGRLQDELKRFKNAEQFIWSQGATNNKMASLQILSTKIYEILILCIQLHYKNMNPIRPSRLISLTN